jgi:hypothetical protein
MRYLTAILFAIPAALLATLYVSGPVANWYTALYTYDDPDAVAAAHATAFMVTNLVALGVGWTIGWWIGGALFRRREA